MPHVPDGIPNRPARTALSASHASSGSVEEVPEVLREHGISSVLLVTDRGIAQIGLTRGLEDALARAGISCATYDKTVANPTVANVEEARALYLESACQAIIGFGGGSSMDCAKAVGARIAQHASPWAACGDSFACTAGCHCSSPYPPRREREAR